MLMVTDIGNTAITLGVFDGEDLRATWEIATDRHRMPDEYATQVLSLLRYSGISRKDIKGVAVCAVVSPLVKVFREVYQRYFNVTPLVVAAGIKTGVRIRMDNPREVGADRIVNAAAAQHLYGGPVIIADFGTATTFDTISDTGEYLGGAIAPGLLSSAEALYTRTAALPAVELMRPKHAIGTNTVEAMQSGLIFGYVGLVENIVKNIQAEYGSPMKVVATGGYAPIIAQETPVIEEVSEHLTLVGLKLIYKMNKL
jgi:type III pantothenate kinase